MPGRRIKVLDIRELVRRFRLGEGDRQIARDMKLSRNSVAKYHQWADREGFLSAPDLPAAGVIEERLEKTLPERSSGPPAAAEPYRDFIAQKRREGVEVRALYALLRERGYAGSYSALLRFVRGIEPVEKETTLRIETGPGEEAQVDFGYAGKIPEEASKRERKAWVFVMTLSYSRHQYAELVFDQKVETWVGLHVRAFEFFGRVPRRIVLDNLRAAIVNAVLYDTEAQRSYRELAEHYGFLISPCRPRRPEHKGKVESGVHYVKRNALAGRSFRNLREGNEHLIEWIFETAGVRTHGTTHERPLDRFEGERESLLPLPPRRYEVTVWKQAKLHPDCHVVYDYSFYSAPFRFVGEALWLRVTPRCLEVFRDHERVATHTRALRRGFWSTLPDHLPPEKLQGLLPASVDVLARARTIGPSTGELVERLLGERPLDRLRSAQAIVSMARRVGAVRLEAACQRALAYNEIRYHTVKSILRKGLDLEPMGAPQAGPLPKTAIFARSVSELLPLN